MNDTTDQRSGVAGVMTQAIKREQKPGPSWRRLADFLWQLFAVPDF
jgi:hypothetical protein